MTTTGAIEREPRRQATGATAASTPTYHSTSYPGGGASKIAVAAVNPFFQPGRSAKSHENGGSTQKTEDTLKTSIAASPMLSRAWHFRAPSSHPRAPQSDSFLPCGAKNKRRLAAARTRRLKPSLSSTVVGACRLGVV